MHVSNQITVDLDSVRLELGQQLQTGESRAKVIDGHADPGAFKLSDRAGELFEARDRLALGELDHNLLRHKTVRLNCARNIDQRHRQQINGQRLSL